MAKGRLISVVGSSRDGAVGHLKNKDPRARISGSRSRRVLPLRRWPAHVGVLADPPRGWRPE